MAEGMSVLVPIGRFSTICKLMIKALHHYDDLGLLRPALTDPQSGYRYYRLDQVATADLIRDLRTAEMPLEEIGKALRDPTAPEAHALLTGQQQRLRDRIAAQHAAIGRLDRLLADEECPAQQYTIELRFVPMQLLVSERLTVLPDELSSAIPRAIAESGRPSRDTIPILRGCRSRCLARRCPRARRWRSKLVSRSPRRFRQRARSGWGRSAVSPLRARPITARTTKSRGHSRR